jgi:hypothetical protein
MDGAQLRQSLELIMLIWGSVATPDKSGASTIDKRLLTIALIDEDQFCIASGPPNIMGDIQSCLPY